MYPRSQAFRLAPLTLLLACGDASAPDPAITTPAASPQAGAGTPGEAGMGSAAGRANDPASPKAALDAAALADLEAMCAAVDHDYNDGTLSDYFRGLECQSDWGKSLRKEADESVSPGRLLLARANEHGLQLDAQHAPACARLAGYIDDVE